MIMVYGLLIVDYSLLIMDYGLLTMYYISAELEKEKMRENIARNAKHPKATWQRTCRRYGFAGSGRFCLVWWGLIFLGDLVSLVDPLFLVLWGVRRTLFTDMLVAWGPFFDRFW